MNIFLLGPLCKNLTTLIYKNMMNIHSLLSFCSASKIINNNNRHKKTWQMLLVQPNKVSNCLIQNSKCYPNGLIYASLMLMLVFLDLKLHCHFLLFTLHTWRIRTRVPKTWFYVLKVTWKLNNICLHFWPNIGQKRKINLVQLAFKVKPILWLILRYPFRH